MGLCAKPTVKGVTIYTDGACRGNPGPGGIGVVLVSGAHEKALSKGFIRTTNNRMELTAAIEGLSALKKPCDVTLYSDSKYLVDAIEKGWVRGWVAQGWKKKRNRDLWERLLPLLEKHRVRLVWVKGHGNDAMNNRCDELAVAAATGGGLVVDEGYEKEMERRAAVGDFFEE